MLGEVFADTEAFGPYEVWVAKDIDRDLCQVRIDGRSGKGVSLRALAQYLEADTQRALLFFNTLYSDYSDGGCLYCMDLRTGEVKWKVDQLPPGRIRLNGRDEHVFAGEPRWTGDSYVMKVPYDGRVLERNPHSG